MSERRACQALGVSRTTQRYQGREDTDEEQRLVARMHELVRAYPRYGYRFIWAKLRQEGWHVNTKKVYRLWRREGFKVPRKTHKKRRLGHSDNSCVRRRAEHPDHVWTWDFIHDRTTAGMPLKWFAITDEHTRECLALQVDRSLTADRVLDVLTNLFLTRGVPRHIRSDNGPRRLQLEFQGPVSGTAQVTLELAPRLGEDHVLSLATLPFAMLWLDRALLRRSAGYGIAAGLAGAMIVLGRDQVALLAIYFLAGYVVAHWLSSPRPLDEARDTLRPLLAGGLAGAVTMTFFAPFCSR